MMKSILLAFACASSLAVAQCPNYVEFYAAKRAPFSTGRYKLSYQRPDPACRTFVVPEVDDRIEAVKSDITDPDLARLFENAYPSTLDSTIRWKGTANDTGEELTFVITGDIPAMWLRDSANQMQSYVPLLKPSSNSSSLASLFRGVINLQARYLLTQPYCQSFQPPAESGLPPGRNYADNGDVTVPPFSKQTVYECKWELDSLAAFLQVSTDYYVATKDAAFFGKHSWVPAVKAILKVANDMMTPTYSSNGTVLASPYSFVQNNGGLINGGVGSPVKGGTGLIRTAFRPSDDSTIYQLFIPANMQFSRFLQSASNIMAQLPGNDDLVKQMRDMASSIRQAILDNGIVSLPDGTKIYAYEVDGYGGANVMDDANIPSLLSAPFIGFLNRSDPVYQSTRAHILSLNNPYYAQGSAISAIGSPHNGPGKAWPMSSIVRILTSDDDDEIFGQLKQLVGSTDGLGLIHESVSAANASVWTRQWFSWVNGLFGQMILDLKDRKPELLRKSYQ